MGLRLAHNKPTKSTRFKPLLRMFQDGTSWAHSRRTHMSTPTINIDNIDQARLLQGLIKRALAHKAEVSPRQLSRLFARETRGLGTLKKVCAALGLALSDVYEF